MKINQIKQLIQEAIQAIFEADLQYQEGDRVEIDSSYGGGIGTVVMAAHPFYAVKFDQTGTTDSFHFSDLRPFDDEEEDEKNADIDTGLSENVLLNEDIKISSNFKYHLNKKLPLHENIFRYGSDAQLQLFKEARELYNKGLLYLNSHDRWLVENTSIGEYGKYNGKLVALDVPMVEEEEHDEILHGYTSETTPEGEHEVWAIYFDPKTNTYNKKHKVPSDTIFGKNAKIKKDFVNEAEYQGKEVQLNKPKRGGSKKFYVYVKDGDKVKKVSFGAAGGGQNLAVKIRDPKARRAFASRQNCARKKDRTTPGYWSCNIGRYWKSLGGGSNFSGYW